MASRAMHKSDLLDCVSVFLKVYNAPPFEDNWSEESAGLRLAELWSTPGCLGFVAEEDHRVLGFVIGHVEHWFNGKRFRIAEICVRPEHQRAGVGTALLEGLTEELVKMDIETVYAHAGRGAAADEFFRIKGFYPNEGLVQLVQGM
jgi:aminoglycoside 6'-N-acetyltransferase I